VLLGERDARLLNRLVVAGMYLLTVVGILAGALSPLTALVLTAAPRAVRAWRVMASPAPSEPPAGYVGWPLWYHRVCLVHNRLFGWVFILGVALGAIWPSLRIGG
jgi:1,4-dihydroxy-2-naphthoate polyprenyltransferase